MIDKNEIMFDYLRQCPELKDLFFNFGESKNGNTVFSTSGNDYVAQEYIDGTALKWYDFTIIQFLRADTYPNSKVNADSLFDFQKIKEWVETRENEGNYPDFGGNCTVHEFYVVPNSAAVAGRDPMGAKYMMTCRIEYEERKETNAR